MTNQSVATRQQTTPATRQPNPYDGLRNQLEKRADDFKMALPTHITPEKFQRTVMTAAQQNPDILRADRASLITSCMKAAQDGLLPDGRESALVMFNTRQKIDNQWVSVAQVQYMPMVFGLRKKILQSGEISAIETNVVYRREVEEGAFIFEGGTEAMLRHRPMLDLTDEDLTDDNIVAAYSVATMKDGTKTFEVMRRAEINKVRQASQTGALGKTKRDGTAIPPKGPWVDWFGEMARKTVMRRHSKTLPMSGDIIDIEAQDELIASRSATTLLASVDSAEPRALPPAREEAHDPVTGEIIDEDEERRIAEALDRKTFAGDAQSDEADEEASAAAENAPTEAEQSAASEGPADNQRGEAMTLERALDEIRSAELAGDVKSRLAAIKGYFAGSELEQLQDAADLRIEALKGRK